MHTTHLEMVLVIVVDDSENDIHKDVKIDDRVKGEEQSKPFALVICRHPENNEKCVD